MERILFVVDYRNYKENGTIGKRPSSRGIIIKDNKLGMVYSRKYDYYKFPGGGIDNGETNEEALVREVKEEVGLEVIKSSIKEYGLAIRKEMGKIEDIFVQENYYYFCEVTDNIFDQKLDCYEEKEGFILKWVSPDEAIDTNLNHDHKEKGVPRGIHMMQREVQVIRMLLREGYLK